MTDCPPGPQASPNIVLIMTDQQRADFTAGSGFGLDTMPFVDSLAASGTRFHRAYTTLPACVPARCSLLTGRFPKAHRVRENHTASAVHRADDLLDVLAERGYRLHFAGKTHFYREPDDFDSFAGPYWHVKGPRVVVGDVEAGEHEGRHDEFERWLGELDHGVSDGPTPFEIDVQFPYRIVSDAINALDQVRPDQPFFSWVSFPEPHNPYQVPAPYFDLFPPEEVPARLCGPESLVNKSAAWRWLRAEMERKRPGYDNDWRQYRANYCGMLRLLDDQIRRYTEALEERGLLENTVIIFVSDHGDYVGEYGLQRKGAGMPECLMRVPMIVSGPGVVCDENGTDFVSLVDVFPTICEIAGAEIPVGVQGRSLWPVLTGAEHPASEFDSIYAECGIGGSFYEADERPVLDPARDYDYSGSSILELNSVVHSGHTAMVRRADWKLLFDSVGRGELYDLIDDPAECDNRFDDPDVGLIRDQLLADLARWSLRTDDDLPVGAYVRKRGAHNWSA